MATTVASLYLKGSRNSKDAIKKLSILYHSFIATGENSVGDVNQESSYLPHSGKIGNFVENQHK